MRRFWVALVFLIAILLFAQTCLAPGPVTAPSYETASPTAVAISAPAASPTAVPTPTATPAPAPSPTPLLTSTPTPTATPKPARPSPDQMLAAVITTERPARDMYDLVRRLKLEPGEEIVKVVNATPPNHEVGRRDTFCIADQEARSYFTVTATIQLVTPHAYFYVQDGEVVSREQLKKAGEAFENRVYPTVHRYFGTEWTPGVDNDPRITILNARIPGLGGYYSTADQYPKKMNPFSNEREMIYINIGALVPGTDRYNATLAHEFQHMVHWNMHRSEDTWVNEGAAELAMRLAGYEVGGVQAAFLANPDTQLNAWTEETSEALAHYGAAYLFISYLAERCGGYEAIKDLIAQDGSGIERVDRYLRGKNLSFDQLFGDWIVANYLDDPSLGGGRYGYKDIDVRVSFVEDESELRERYGAVYQYAADYFRLSPPVSDFEVLFDGADTVKVVPNEARSGEMQWWSNRGDVMDTTLTRRFDLSKVEKATLQFWTWYDIEKNFDFAYVVASDDGGKTWKTLEGRFTTSSNPLGTNLGHGYTGKSGGGAEPRWVREEIDLSAYAGREVLIRFEYVTDDAYNSHGFCVDDIAIPELGFVDSVEEADQWEARGFIRLRNVLPQRFAVHLITKRDRYEVQPVPLDAELKGRVTVRGLGKELHKAVLVVAALSPGTTEPARYTYNLRPITGQ